MRKKWMEMFPEPTVVPPDPGERPVGDTTASMRALVEWEQKKLDYEAYEKALHCSMVARSLVQLETLTIDRRDGILSLSTLERIAYVTGVDYLMRMREIE